MKKKYLITVLFLAISLITYDSFSQTTRFWSGGSPSSDNIDQGSNWFNGNPNSGDNLHFNNTCGSCRQWAFSNYGGGSFFGDLIVFNGAQQIRFYGDNSYFLKIENFNSPSLLEIENNTIGNRIGSDLEINPVGSGGITILSSTITIDNSGGAKQIRVFGNETLTINASIIDTNGSGGSFNIIDAATVFFNADNTYSGSTTVNNGTLVLSNKLMNSDVTVNNGATLIIDGNDVVVNSLTVNSGGNIIVNIGKTLTVSNNLNTSGVVTLNSDSQNYSSLIVNGTSTGNVTYNRYVNNNAATGGNDLISAPVSGQAFDVFIANNTNILAEPDPGIRVLFGGFDIDANEYELWNETDTTPLAAGQGYRSGIDQTAGNNIVQFEGIVNTSTVGSPISVGTGSKWNLIGNPYPSYLSAQAFLAQNSSLLDPTATAIYGYNNDTDALAGGQYTIVNNFTSYQLAPGQGFFVASSVTGGNVQFLTSMRSISGGDDFIQGRESNVITNVKLSLSNSTESFLTDFYFSEFSTLGLDPGYDASLFGGAAPAFSIYSHLVEGNTGVPYGIQALGETDYNDVTIALGVNASQGEQITFTIDSSTIPSTVDVFLDDVVANTSTQLNSMDYILTPSTNLSGTGRFFIRFAEESLSTQNHNFENIDIYVSKQTKEMVINGLLVDQTMLNIYDIQGRLITKTQLNHTLTENRIKISNVSNGIYIVKLKNNSQELSKKVIID